MFSRLLRPVVVAATRTSRVAASSTTRLTNARLLSSQAAAEDDATTTPATTTTPTAAEVAAATGTGEVVVLGSQKTVFEVTREDYLHDIKDVRRVYAAEREKLVAETQDELRHQYTLILRSNERKRRKKEEEKRLKAIETARKDAMRKAEKAVRQEKRAVHREKLEQLRRAEQVHQLKMIIAERDLWIRTPEDVTADLFMAEPKEPIGWWLARNDDDAASKGQQQAQQRRRFDWPKENPIDLRHLVDLMDGKRV
jgi:hypothetical protein